MKDISYCPVPLAPVAPPPKRWFKCPVCGLKYEYGTGRSANKYQEPIQEHRCTLQYVRLAR